MADFLAALDAFVAQAGSRADAVVRGIAEQALATVKGYTPVDTGNLRAAWSIVPAGEAVPVVASQARDEARGDTGVPLTIDLSGIAAGEIIRIVNPVSYARAVEYGYVIKLKDGGSRQVEGRLMATRTMAELPQIAARVVRDVVGGA